MEYFKSEPLHELNEDLLRSTMHELGTAATSITSQVDPESAGQSMSHLERQYSPGREQRFRRIGTATVQSYIRTLGGRR